MAERILPTPDQLRQLLRYEPDTGKLFWLPRPRDMFATQRSFGTWNSRYAGREAFISVMDGYRVGTVFNGFLRAHRVAWAIYHGNWPRDQIDHINGIRDDNRIENLRQATHAENRQNHGPHYNNTSGFKGVKWNNQKNKWQAEIKAHGKRMHLGFFVDPRSAHAAYCAAARKYHGEFARYE